MKFTYFLTYPGIYAQQVSNQGYKHLNNIMENLDKDIFYLILLIIMSFINSIR